MTPHVNASDERAFNRLRYWEDQLAAAALENDHARARECQHFVATYTAYLATPARLRQPTAQLLDDLAEAA
jgi:hypothetical protein